MKLSATPRAGLRHELLTALRDAGTSWIPDAGTVHPMALSPEEREYLIELLSGTLSESERKSCGVRQPSQGGSMVAADRNDEGMTQEQIAERNAKRSIQLALTHRMALAMLKLARAGRRKAERQHQSNVAAGWKPEPGRYDMNLARIGQFDDIIAQLQTGLGLDGQDDRQA